MRHFLLLIGVALASATHAQPLPQTDRARLAEAFRLSDAVGPDLWAEWSAVPLAVLLVVGEREYLIRHPDPSPDFVLVDAYDALLDSPVYARDRRHSPHLLATFPAVEGVPTVVVGTPEQTGLSSTAWVLTLLHEHTHQLQMSSPGYYAAVDALDLDGGDETGMWMLTYPFPYTAPEVAHAFGDYASALRRALEGDVELAALDESRQRLRSVLSEADDRYLSFQLWQEGVARYVEIKAAKADVGVPLAAFASLPDAVPYASVADTLHQRLLTDLEGADLTRDGRVALYAAGAAHALLLDAVRPGWQRRYLTDRFDLESLEDVP